MDNKKFKAPDDATIRRMTPFTISSLLETLREQRKEKVRYIDAEIGYYEELLAQKQIEAESA